MSSAEDPAADPLPIGSRVGESCKVTGVLGRGGMSIVYLGYHERLRVEVAIKILLPRIAQDAGVCARFLAEARALARISDPGIVKVHDFGTQGDIDYIIMERLQGRSLKEWPRPRQGPVDPVAQDIFRQVARALSVVHRYRIVHRDVKPENLHLLGEPPDRPEVKLLDFGIAKVDQAGDPSETDLETRVGETLGTPMYQAPEQIGDACSAGPAADVYALGVTMYEFFSGRPPFQGAKGELIMQHLRQAAPPLVEQASWLPPRICRLIDAMLAKDPPARPSIDEVLRTLEGDLNAPEPASPSMPDGPLPPPVGPTLELPRWGRRLLIAALLLLGGALALVAPRQWLRAGPIPTIPDLGSAPVLRPDLSPPPDQSAPDLLPPADLARPRKIDRSHPLGRSDPERRGGWLTTKPMVDEAEVWEGTKRLDVIHDGKAIFIPVEGEDRLVKIHVEGISKDHPWRVQPNGKRQEVDLTK